MPTIERQTLAALTVVSLAVGAVAGCGTQTDGRDSAAEPRPTTRHTTEAPATPSPPSDTETPAVTTSPSAQPSPSSSEPPAATGLAGRLLEAAEVPGFDDGFTWSTSTTGKGEGTGLSGRCHEYALTSIGAFKVVHRAFTPAADGSQASQGAATAVVAQFPDADTARRADAVLRSWHDKCAERHNDTDVGPLQDVPIDDALGGWYLLSHGSTQDAQGYARRGSRIAVLTLSTDGGEHTYAPGDEPMAIAIRRAAEKL
jgi:hypothetical protein